MPDAVNAWAVASAHRIFMKHMNLLTTSANLYSSSNQALKPLYSFADSLLEGTSQATSYHIVARLNERRLHITTISTAGTKQVILIAANMALGC